MTMQHYDYLIVGAGLFGPVFAYKTMRQSKSCLVIDCRPHLSGNPARRKSGLRRHDRSTSALTITKTSFSINSLSTRNLQ